MSTRELKHFGKDDDDDPSGHPKRVKVTDIMKQVIYNVSEESLTYKINVCETFSGNPTDVWIRHVFTTVHQRLSNIHNI